MHLLAVNFHYFRDLKPGQGIYPTSRRELESQVDILAEHFDRFVSGQDLLAIWQNKSDPPKERLCLLTFDDGLKEQMQAFDLLKKKGVPAIFFASTDPIKFKKALSVHKLHHCRANLPDSDLISFLDNEPEIKETHIDESILKTQYRYDNPLSARIKYILNFLLSEPRREQIINQLFSQIFGQEKKFAEEIYMNESDLEILSQSGCLGTHGASHRPLALLSDNEARADLLNSIQFLYHSTGVKPDFVSYPYGGPTAVSAKTAEIAAEAGLSLGFTMQRGLNTFHDLKHSPLLLKRVDTNDAPGGRYPIKEYFR